MQVIRHGGPEGKFVGCVSLTPWVAKSVMDLGYYLHPDHQGKGIMGFAAVAVLIWAKNVFEVRRVCSRCVFFSFFLLDAVFGKGEEEWCE